MANDGDPGAIGAPGRGVEELLTTTRRDALHAATVGADDVDVLLEEQVCVPMATGGEGDPRAVRAPTRLPVVRLPRGQASRRAQFEVDTPELAGPVIGESRPVELIEEPVDLADVRIRHRLLRLPR